MSKDPHKKRQKQIRMSDEVRARFETAQKASGLTAETFVERMLDAYEGRNGPSKSEIIAYLKDALPD